MNMMTNIEFISKETSISMGFEEIINALELRTPFGRKQKSDMTAYRPGEEAELAAEYARIVAFSVFRKENVPFARALDIALDKVKDIRRSVVAAAEGVVLDEVELFELKAFLLLVDEIETLVRKVKIPLPEVMLVSPLPNLLDRLDLTKSRQCSFYIDDAYSEKLLQLRTAIRLLERDLYALAKDVRQAIKEETGVTPRSTGEIMAGKQETELLAKLEASGNVSAASSTFSHIIYKMKPTAHMQEIEAKLDVLRLEQEQEEFAIRQALSAEIGVHDPQLEHSMDAIGRIDLCLSKARLFERLKCTVPEIVTGATVIEIINGRHPVVEANLRKKDRKFVPVTITVTKGAAIVTGANMGGKTVTLKTAAVLLAMAQYGMPVPAELFKFSLCNFIFYSGGDYQSLDEGLSTFGAEIQRLRDMLPFRDMRGLYCLDELARGTNPSEGYAIASAVVSVLHESASMTLITTHFEGLARDTRFCHWQVRGLKDADFKEIRSRMDAESRGGIEVLHEYMDYRLERIDSNHSLPKDALNVARLMGMDQEVLKIAESTLAHTAES